MIFAAIDKDNFSRTFQACSWEEAEEYCSQHALIQCGELLEEIDLTDQEYEDILEYIKPKVIH